MLPLNLAACARLCIIVLTRGECIASLIHKKWICDVNGSLVRPMARTLSVMPKVSWFTDFTDFTRTRIIHTGSGSPVFPNYPSKGDR